MVYVNRRCCSLKIYFYFTLTTFAQLSGRRVEVFGAPIAASTLTTFAQLSGRRVEVFGAAIAASTLTTFAQQSGRTTQEIPGDHQDHHGDHRDYRDHRGDPICVGLYFFPYRVDIHCDCDTVTELENIFRFFF